VGVRKSFGLEPVNQYPHLQWALYKQVLFRNKLFGSIPVYLVVLNKLKVCAINAPLLLLSTGGKQKEFCRWLLDGVEGLTMEERVMYKSYLFGYNLIEDEEVKREMAGKRIKRDYGAVFEVFGPPTPEEMAKLILKVAKTKQERKELLDLLRQEIENSEDPTAEGRNSE